MSAPRLLLLCWLSLLMGGCNRAPDPPGVIRLTYGSPFPVSHPYSKADQQWIAAVERRSGGRIRVTPYWGGSMISNDHAVTELRHGLTDIAAISPIYARSGMTAVKAQSGFYQGARTEADQVRVYHCLARNFPVFDTELGGMHALAVQGGALIHVVTRDRAVRTIADLRGLRLRAPSELIPVLGPLGVDVQTMPMAGVYSSLSKGMIDGVVAAPDTLKTFHFGEVARYISRISIYRGAYPARAVSERAWRRLPAELQALLTDLTPFWEQQLTRQIEAAQVEGLRAAASDRIRTTDFDPAGQAVFDRRYHDSADGTAAALDERGVPGTRILRTARTVIATGRCPAP